MDVKSSKSSASFADIITMMQEKTTEPNKNWKLNIRSRMESDLDSQVQQALEGDSQRWSERKKKHKRMKNIQMMKLNALRRSQVNEENIPDRNFKYINANYQPSVGHHRKRLQHPIAGFEAPRSDIFTYNGSLPLDYRNSNGRLDPSLLDTGSGLMNFFQLAKREATGNLRPLLPGVNNYSSVKLPNYGENRKCFQMYSKAGLNNILSSRLKRNKLSYVGQGSYVDKKGIVISKHGPFWPPGYGPVCQCSKFVEACPEKEKFGRIATPTEKFHENKQENFGQLNMTQNSHWKPPGGRNLDKKSRIEPLSHNNNNNNTKTINAHLNNHQPSNNRISNTLSTENNGKPVWRGKPVIYDSERSSRTPLPHAVPEGMCPSLVFESRFESGNLRQVRRIGEYEYELVLRTDLYTKRHTQWFYFRLQKAQPNVTYKLTIINLLKKDSLYNYGMKPLVYSELLATQEGLGWHRAGENISYTPWHNPTRNGLLSVDLNYHSLEFELTFDWTDVENDSIYVAHCYPYTYSDLKNHIDGVMVDEARSQHVKREVLCETTAGNACFLLTITEFPDKEKDKYKDLHETKKGVVLTARVHPGETQASWMMKGAIDFLTSDESIAHELRRKFIFKIVPMLNPDGVIVGNYRTSLTARDLNRNYRHPRQVAFPTIWHTKQMVQHFSNDHEIVLYCDLHGHSRKPMVFMYGCERKALYKGAEEASKRSPRDCAKDFVDERLFPWLMSKQAPQRFSFHASKYGVRRCKEATGRVVMFRQMGVMNSFTMEASFSGTANKNGGIGRHFNISDFEAVGRSLCECVLEYDRVVNDPIAKGRVVMDITKDIAQHMMENQKLMASAVLNNNRKESLRDNNNNNNTQLSPRGNLVALPAIKPSSNDKQGQTKNIIKSRKSATDNIDSQDGSSELSTTDEESKLNRRNIYSDEISIVTSETSSLTTETEQSVENENQDDSCYRLLEQLHLHELKIESDTSSDSDSESDPELPEAPPTNRPKKKKRRKKQRPNYMKSISAPSNMLRSNNQLKEDLSKPKTFPGFVNRYANRSNGGIPIYAQERVQERAARRLAELRRREDDKVRRRDAFRQQLLVGDVDLDAILEKDEDSKNIYGEVYGIRYQLGQHPQQMKSYRNLGTKLTDETEVNEEEEYNDTPRSNPNNVLQSLLSNSPLQDQVNPYRTAEVSFCNLTFEPKTVKHNSSSSRASTASTAPSSDGIYTSPHHSAKRHSVHIPGTESILSNHRSHASVRPSTQGATLHHRHNVDLESVGVHLETKDVHLETPKTTPPNGLVFAVHKVKVIEPSITDKLTLTNNNNMTSAYHNKSNTYLKTKSLSATIVNGRSRNKKVDPSFNVNSAI